MMKKCLSNTDDIFFNTWKVVREKPNYFLYIFIGGRGTGKTYSSLKPYETKEETGLLYVRRTDTEIQNCCNEYFNPFKKLNEDLDKNIIMKKTGKYVVVQEEHTIEVPQDDGAIKEEIVTDHIGYAGALSTFGNLRGADFSDVDTIIFDEFINTSPHNTLKNEATLLFNLIETVNRNRELLGEESVKVILLSNSNSVDNDLIRVLGLADIIRAMKSEGRGVYEDEERGIYFELLSNKNFKDMKEKTRLYRLTKGTNFFDMALENDFTSDYFGDVKRLKYTDLTPMTAFNTIYFYRHKSTNIIYVSRRKANVKVYDMQTANAFKRDFGFAIGNAIERGNILYQDYDIKLEVQHLFD